MKSPIEPSRDFVQLREALYSFGCKPGDKEMANKVIRLVHPEATLAGCFRDPLLASRVLDELIAQYAVGWTGEEILAHALSGDKLS